jgi:alkylhydroperoxidase family enzyme
VDADVSGPRIRPRDPGEVGESVRSIFDIFLRERGNIPDMFRTVAVRPRHLETLVAHFLTVMNERNVPTLLKELLAIRVSSINRCRY